MKIELLDLGSYLFIRLFLIHVCDKNINQHKISDKMMGHMIYFENIA